MKLYGLRGVATSAVVLSWLTLTGETTFASDAEKYVVLGHGVSSCATFSSDVRDGHKSSYIAWLLGYFTAINEARKGASNILARTDVNGGFAWIENYCRSHPTEETFRCCACADPLSRSRNLFPAGRFGREEGGQGLGKGTVGGRRFRTPFQQPSCVPAKGQLRQRQPLGSFALPMRTLRHS